MSRAPSALVLAALLLSPPAARAGEPGSPPAMAGAAAPTTASPPLATVSFEEAVRRAKANAVTSVLAADGIRRAEGLLAQARAGSLPALALAGDLTRLDSNRVAAGRVVAAAGQEGASATLSVPLVAPSRWTQWAHAADAVDVARAGEADAARGAALTAARAYLAVVAGKRSLEVARLAVENARAHYDFAAARRAGGVGTALDELRAEQQLATSGAQVESALSSIAAAQEALGIATGGEEPLDAQAEPALSSAVATPADAMRDAAADRTDLRAAAARAGAAARVARDSWVDWLPTLLATGQGFYQHPPTLTTPQTGWQAQLVLSFPLFEGGLRAGQRGERQALAAEAQTQLDGLLRQARAEVRTAWSTVEHAEAALREARRAATSADAALALVTDAYRAGAITSLDVSDAEQRARDADTAAVVAEDGVRQARLDLLAATGHFP